jgi:GTPase
MLIDDVSIKVKAGNGGPGAVAFNNIKMSLGPAGASGGAGGSVYAIGVSDISALGQFRHRKSLEAKNGEPGKPQFNDGHTGEDLVIKLPVGTVVHNLDLNIKYELSKIGERILLAQGGKGGRGNFHFKSAHNTSPTQFQKGLPGEAFSLHFELKLIADVGFVGFPNVGKSSLLNSLTRAESKVANYAFTTLEPNLGAYYELILADLPGLIEGASEGKGLGIKFLKHVERTNILFHFVSAETDDVIRDYNVIRGELGAYHPALLEKKEFLFLSKSDAVDEKTVKEKLKLLKTVNKNAIAISILDDESIEKVKKILNKIKDEKMVKDTEKEAEEKIDKKEF